MQQLLILYRKGFPPLCKLFTSEHQVCDSIQYKPANAMM